MHEQLHLRQLLQLKCVAFRTPLSIRQQLLRGLMAYPSRETPTVDPETEAILAASMKAKAKPKQRPRSFDPARRVKADPRDPRTRGEQWPCFNKHIPGPPMANQWGPMDHMPVLQSQAALHSSEGSASEHYGHGQPCNGEAHAIGATSAPGGNEAHVDYLPPRDEQDHGGDCAPQGSAGTGEWPDGRHRLNPSSARDLGDDFTDYELNVGHAAGRRRGADSGLRERDHRVLMRPSGVDSKGAPLYIGKKLMAMAAMMTTATTSLLLGLHLEGRDGLWEITCAPHTEEHGLQPRRINRTSGYDLYKAETWEELRQLRRRKWPRRLWFSLPYTKWDHWSSVNYNTEDKKERLDTARRKERRLLWYANQFIKEATREDEEVDVYLRMASSRNWLATTTYGGPRGVST